jgi:hypothetical protein
MAEDSGSDDTEAAAEALSERKEEIGANSERVAVEKSEQSDFSERVENGEMSMEDFGTGYIPQRTQSLVQEMQESGSESENSNE